MAGEASGKRLHILLVRYLLIFLFFAALLMLLFVPVYHYVTEFTLDNELTYITNGVEQGIAIFNTTISSLEHLILSTNRNPSFSIFREWHIHPPNQDEFNSINPVTLLELRNAFNLALASHSLLADTGILFPNGTMITRNGILYYQTNPFPFYGTFLECKNIDFEEWKLLLSIGSNFKPEQTYSSAYYGEYNAVTYAANWGYMGFPEKIIFFATLPIDRIITLLIEKNIAEAAYIKMYNSDGKLLFSQNEQSGGHFHIISRQSSPYSIIYEIGIPDSFIMQKLQPLRNLMILFACITAAFVILLSSLFAWRTSQPEMSFIEHIRQSGIATTKFNKFTSLKHIYKELGEAISTKKSQLETSLQIIETQTVLIRIHTIEKIQQALISGDEFTAKAILQDCFTALSRPEDPIITAFLEKMLQDMISGLKYELPEIDLSIKPPVHTGSQEDIFEKQYPLYFEMICKKIRAYKEKNISSLGREVLEYINENLYNSALYITMVANHFNISAPTLQKLVKQCTSQTFLDYVEKCRMERACELLSNSNESVSSIAHSCGFSNAATFSRCFKRRYGFPPSRLQESHNFTHRGSVSSQEHEHGDV